MKELRYILEIAKHLNLTRAAQALYISQPSLSKYLQSVEKHVGMPLFARVGNRLRMTYAGERYVEYAQQMMRIKKSMDEELLDIRRGQTGRIRVAIPMLRSAYVMPQILPAFKEAFPGVDVILLEQPSKTLEEMVLRGEADIALVNRPDESDALQFEPLVLEAFVLVVQSDHLLAKRAQPAALEAFSKESFVLNAPDQRTGELGRRLLASAGITPQIAAVTRSVEGAASMAAQGMGAAFLPEGHYRHLGLKGTKKILLTDPMAQSEFGVLWHKQAYLPSHTRAFIDLVREKIPELFGHAGNA